MKDLLVQSIGTNLYIFYGRYTSETPRVLNYPLPAKPKFLSTEIHVVI